jgi:hypothetical protein
MTTLSARVMRARKDYRCDTCGKIIFTNSRYLRLYGFVNSPEEDMSTLRLHPKCVINLNIKDKIEDEFKRTGVKYTIDEHGILIVVEE